MFFFAFITRIFSLSCSSTLELSKTGQHHFFLIDGTSVCLKITKPYTLLIFDSIDESTITPEIFKDDGTLYDFEPQSYVQSNFSGIWFGNKLGNVQIVTKVALTARFTYVIFQSDCEIMYFSNTRESTFSVSSLQSQYKTICYFNGVYGDYSYKFNYNLPDGDYFRLIRNDGFLREYTGNNYFKGISHSDDPVVVYMSTENNMFKSNVTTQSSCDDIIPDTNLTQFVQGTEPKLLYGEYLNDFEPIIEEDLAGKIVTICLIVIFLACIIGCITYKIYRCYKNKKEQEIYDLIKASAPKKKYKKIIRNHKNKNFHADSHELQLLENDSDKESDT